MNRDLEHLKLLSIFHYVYGGLTGLFACVPLIHVAVGIALMVAGATAQPREPAAAGIGALFVVIGGAAVLIGWTFAGLTLAAGRCLGRRKHYTFCLVIACLSCLNIPLGTVLGVFTIIVLSRPSVRYLFQIGDGIVSPPTPAPVT
jgi:hypothetical protein